jgi:hypothetical protein
MSLSRQLDTAFDQVPYPTPRSTAASNLTQPFLPAVESPKRVGSGRPRQFARMAAVGASHPLPSVSPKVSFRSHSGHSAGAAGTGLHAPRRPLLTDSFDDLAGAVDRPRDARATIVICRQDKRDTAPRPENAREEIVNSLVETASGQIQRLLSPKLSAGYRFG